MKHGSVKIDPTSIPYYTWTEIEMKLSLNISVFGLNHFYGKISVSRLADIAAL